MGFITARANSNCIMEDVGIGIGWVLSARRSGHILYSIGKLEEMAGEKRKKKGIGTNEAPSQAPAPEVGDSGALRETI